MTDEDEVEQLAAEINPWRDQRPGADDFHTLPLIDLSQLSINDSVGLYFRELGQEKLLLFEEEVALAQEIEAGRAAAVQLEKERLGEEAKVHLTRLKETGDMAWDRLLRANTRLVISIAKRYRGRGLHFLDLIQEGNLGLIKAVEKYDYRRGNRFSTLATWWIKQAVTRALANHGRTIRVPAHIVGQVNKLYWTAQQLMRVHNREPTVEEMAESMTLSAERVRWLLRISLHPLHLEHPTGAGSEAELGDFIEDREAVSPLESVAQRLLSEEIGEVLDQLSAREAHILRLRYGLGDGHSHTLKEIGDLFGLSRERIRQLEKEALRKLRHPKLAGHLRHYLD